MKSNSFPCFTRLQYSALLLLVTLLLVPLQVTAQNLDSRSGDEAALEALYTSLNTPSLAGWGSTMSLSNSIDGVTVETIDGELRVTEIDLRSRGLTGNIEVPEVGNLKEMITFAVYGNSLNSQIPQELMDLTQYSLEYIYLSFGDAYGDMDTVYPHQKVDEPGDGDLHPSKRKTNENNIFTGTLPAPSDPAASGLKWLVLNWTDSAVGAEDGLSGVDTNLFNITTFEGIHIYNNNNISSFDFPTGILNMTGLRHLAIGVEKSGYHTGPLTGNIPGGFLSDLPNLSHVRLNENPSLSIDFDQLETPGPGHPLRVFSLVVVQITGDLPSFFFDGTTTPNQISMIISWPAGGSSGVTRAHPEVDSNMRVKIYQYRNHSLTSLPASLWTEYGGIIQPEFTGNNLTTIGTQDLTQQDQMRFLWLADNELHENWPYLDWNNHDPISGGVRFENNRYVFKHMLYVPPNAPNGETVLELWQDLSGNDVSYAPQKPFGESRTISYTAGSDVTIDDFDGIVTHPGNRYQWQKDGSDVSGATSRSLTISEAGSADEGTYRLVVTNPGAPELTLTSEPVTLQVGDGDSGGGDLPDVPSPVSPSDGATGISTAPTLDWQAATNAATYRVQVSMSSGFSTTVSDITGLTATQYTATGLSADSTYYWRVRASNSSGPGDWSQVRSFTTATDDGGGSDDTTESPSAPLLNSPSNNAQNVTLIPTFEWDSVDADYYVLQVSSAESIEAVIETEVQTTTYTIREELSLETQYSWRVRAVKDGVEGGWSTEWKFTTGTAEEMETSLEQNYPNPFNPSTQIRFTLGETQQVSLKVYDTVGRVVATIVEGTLTAGSYERTFNADNLASGVYFLRFITENRVLTSQMTLMK